ncbi:MAG: DUF4346 domain-containing protein [Candidatus Woesearchaeota archaeon]
MDKPNINLTIAEKGEWTQDPQGYFLIEPRPQEHLIYAHHYNNNQEYTNSIAGKTAEEIYYTIIRLNLVSTLQHSAYLGSELKKAEIAMKTNQVYIQDEELK